MIARSQKRSLFSDIFTEYYPMVFNSIYLKTGSSHDTEDLCQEVFIALYNNLDEVKNIRAWLYGTLRNMVMQYYRKKNPGQANIDDIFDDIALRYVNGFRDTRIIISQIMTETAADDTIVSIMELVAYHKYSYRETAEILGITKRQVEYKYNQMASLILSKLRERGVKHIEDLL